MSPEPSVADAILGPHGSARGLEGIAQGIIGQGRVIANAVVVQVDGGVHEAHQSLEVLVEPIADVSREGAPGAVLGAKTPSDRNVGPPQSILRGRQRLAQEHEPYASAVADGGFGDDERDGDEAILLLKKPAHIEPAVVQGAKLRDRCGLFRLVRDGRLRVEDRRA